MGKQLKIAVWDANGLVNHCQELKIFIANHKLDIILISETHMTDKSYIKIPMYTIYHTHHPEEKARGDTAVIVNNSVKHHEIAKYKHRNLQATAVEIEDWHGKLILAAVYCPPNLSIKKEQFKSFFLTLGHRFIAGGDFNAKHCHWVSRLVTPRGRQHYQAIIRNNLQQLSTGQPTYWPTDRHKIPDVIDFCVTKGIARNYLNIESCLELSSDHSPLLIILETQVTKISRAPVLSSKNTNWEIFRDILTSQLNLNIPLKTEDDVD
jgi:exonuclease III